MTTVVKFRYTEAELFSKHPEFWEKLGRKNSGQEQTTLTQQRKKTDPQIVPRGESTLLSPNLFHVRRVFLKGLVA
jgi:hypothetical protein